MRFGFFRRRSVRIAAIAVGAIVLAGVIADVALDEPMRRLIERRMNERMVGYEVVLPNADFHLVGGAVDLEDLVISQKAHPDPPVLAIPRLTASVEWRALLRGRLVGELEFEEPSGYINLVQLQEENRDEVPIEQRGWQQAFRSIYPLQIDELRIDNGTLIYEDTSGFRPLHASEIHAVVRNIRNVLSHPGEYPSEFQLVARVFDEGHAVIEGAADLLREPYPALIAHVDLESVVLDYFEPVVQRYGLTVSRGVLTGAGRLELVPPEVSIIELDWLEVTDAAIDYRFGTPADERAAVAARKVADTARETMADPDNRLFRIARLSLEGGEIGFVNLAAEPDYRLVVTDANLQVENLSSRPQDGPGTARLQGTFMGSGAVNGTLTFYPEGDGPNFASHVEINDTDLRALNDLLRAHANLDVVGGVLSVYSEVRVQEGYIDGYVKPLFRDVDVFDKSQDKGEGFFHKMKEKIVGGVAKLLENEPRDEVATVARFHGPVENPDANTVQMVMKLVQNGFFEAILPGFLDEAGRRKKGGKDRDKRDGDEVGG